MQGQDNFDVDQMINQLMSVKAKGELVNLDVASIHTLIEKVVPIMLAEPSLLKINGPVTVGANIHGGHYDQIRYF